MGLEIKAGSIERRLFLTGAWLIGAGSLIAWLVFSFHSGLSVLVGGALAGINLSLLRATVSSALLHDSRSSKLRIIGGYLLRLLLIPLCLYAMIRFLFLDILAAVAGFALFNCSIFVEGILEAFKAGSK